MMQRAFAGEPVDLGRLAVELNEEIARAWPDRHPEIALPERCLAEGDPQLLRLLLQNLLENAWKYSGRNPSPKIEFGCETIDGRQVCYVRDSGVGFDMAHAGRLFTPF